MVSLGSRHLRLKIRPRFRSNGFEKSLFSQWAAGMLVGTEDLKEMEGRGRTKREGHATQREGRICNAYLLSNLFLHFVLDQWFAGEVQPRLKWQSFLIRYADEFVMGFSHEEEARRVIKVLPK
jgi:hypothetical protein